MPAATLRNVRQATASADRPISPTPRLRSRTRTAMSIGVPAKPNSSRSRRSRNRRYPGSRNPVVNRTNRGGRVPAWVANSTRGARRRGPAAGSRRRPSDSQEFSRPVGDPLFPRRQRRTQRRREPVDARPVLRRDVDPGGPAQPAQVPVDLPLEPYPAVLVDEVPLVEGERPAPGRRRRPSAMTRWSCSLIGSLASSRTTATSAASMRRRGTQARVVLGAAGLA